MQGVASLNQALVVYCFFDSAQDIFDLLTHDDVLKVLDLLLVFFLKTFKNQTRVQISIDLRKVKFLNYYCSMKIKLL